MAQASLENLNIYPGYMLEEVSVTSSMDGSEEPNIVGHPEGLKPGNTYGERIPLLVGIHSWSTDRYSSTVQQAEQAANRGWLAVFPDFRGPNRTNNPRVTEAGASLLAQHDIMDAVEYMKANYPVDENRIYIMGGSGGGHMSLMMACKYPDVWAAVSSWCPITSMTEWWEEQNAYAVHVEAVCSGKPGDSQEVDWAYTRRSPRPFITNILNLRTRITHGQMDTTIDYMQTMRTYNVLRAYPGHVVELFSDARGHTADYADGAQWLEDKVKAGTPPKYQHLVTDEAKSFWWCTITPAMDDALAYVNAGVVEKNGEVSIEVWCKGAAEVTLNLDTLGVDATDPAANVTDGILVVHPDTPDAESTFQFAAVRS